MLDSQFVISDARVAALVADIDRKGFAMLQGFVDSNELVAMRAFVAKAVKEAGGEYAGFTGPQAVAGSGLDELATLRPFRDLMERIYQCGTGSKAPDQPFHQVLRCLTGHSVAVHSYRFHYDSYVLTSLIPIIIPTEGKAGDLLMLPNTRGIRSSYARNVVDKVILDNPVSQFVLRAMTKAGLLRLTRIKMEPGNIYFFWGYRTVHTNEPCDIDKVRATALFHYVNPHAGASVRLRQAIPEKVAA